jgi:hypothetical protein
MARAVERLMNFVANLTSFSNEKYECDTELAVNLLNEIIPFTNAKDKAVRFRACQLASKLLNRCVCCGVCDAVTPEKRYVAF